MLGSVRQWALSYFDDPTTRALQRGVRRAIKLAGRSVVEAVYDSSGRDGSPEGWVAMTRRAGGIEIQVGCPNKGILDFIREQLTADGRECGSVSECLSSPVTYAFSFQVG